MHNIIADIGANIFYEGTSGEFEHLCEALFLKNLFKEIKILMQEKFDEYNFYIFSYGWKQDMLPPSAFYKTEKKKILIYISDESANVPYYLSPYYYGIFKVYLRLDKFFLNNIFNKK